MYLADPVSDCKLCESETVEVDFSNWEDDE